MIVGIWVLLSILMTLTATDALRVYQRGSYRRREYVQHLSSRQLGVRLVSVALAVVCAYLIGYLTQRWELGWCGIAIGYMVQVIDEAVAHHTPPLKLTARCKRLGAVVIVLNLITVAAVCTLAVVFQAAAWGGFLPIIELLIVPLSGAILSPYEASTAKKFITLAKSKLATIQPLIIGITGSYGKTSCKTALATILSVKFQVCASPASYNTPMGLCRTVNEELRKEHEILIAEMGARYTGDITELTAIAPPSLAVITGIGTQHLETFGTKLALENTKFELVEGMSEGGKAFFADDEGSKRLAARGKGYVVDDPTSPYYVAILDSELTESGSSFTLVTKMGSRRVHTRLIGAHNLANLRLVCTVASAMGLTLNQLAEGIEKVVPTKHRLELLQKKGNFQVIDDSYNASMEGVRASVEVLTLFPRKRVVITPGIMEGGEESAMNNFRAGCLFAGASEYAFIYGANVRQLAKGLMAGGMREKCIFRVRGRAQAVKELQTLASVRVVLFSNDLPN